MTIEQSVPTVRPSEPRELGRPREPHEPFRPWLVNQILLGQSVRVYARSLVTPFNAVAGVIVTVGVALIAYRFARGLASTTNLSNTNPWGLWIGFDVLCGIALAAGAYTLGTVVYILGLDEYHGIMRATILTGFLGYVFAVIGLTFDLGQPWRIPYPLTISMGFTSVMFLIAWHFLTYLTCLFVEFSPALFEWLGIKKLREWVGKITIGTIIVGAFIATLHQAGLGALFLMTPNKLHPLWYSPLLPVYFFMSSLVAGLGMVVIETSLSHRIFDKLIRVHVDLKGITFGLSRTAALLLFAYFWLKVIGIVHGNDWALLDTPYGYWFLVEMIVFIQLPSFLFLWGAQYESLGLVRFAAAVAVLGVVVNRLNVSIIAFNWNVPDRYFPAWTEIWITVTLVTLGVLCFRWIVNRLPIFYEHPEYPHH